VFAYTSAVQRCMRLRHEPINMFTSKRFPRTCRGNRFDYAYTNPRRAGGRITVTCCFSPTIRIAFRSFSSCRRRTAIFRPPRSTTRARSVVVGRPGGRRHRDEHTGAAMCHRPVFSLYFYVQKHVPADTVPRNVYRSVDNRNNNYT
jgi:hypothetical protein